MRAELTPNAEGERGNTPLTPGANVRAGWECQYVVPLTAPESADAARVGGKAAVLSRLLAAGFPVPDGIVVTAEAFAAYLKEHGSNLERADREVFAQPIPAAVTVALSKTLSRFGDEALAVRSSCITEDLAGASFAGQYETVLGARGERAVLEAVRTCWASVLSPRVRAYRASHGVAASEMAVLIQPMIQADAAGVAFTADPVTGDPGTTVVSAVRGAGDRLASGSASPDEWLVRGRSVERRKASEDCLTESQVREVAELARRLETHLGAPQDVEWALSGGALYVLQARPITTRVYGSHEAVKAAALDAPEGFWQRADSHYPQPLYPFTRSVLLPAANAGFRRMCGEFGLLYETVEEREIGGWVYLRGIPLGGGRDREPPPDWLMRILVRALPRLRRRLRTCSEAAHADRAGQWVETWYGALRKTLEERIADLGQVGLAGISDGDLAAHARSLDALLMEGQQVHMMLNTALNLLVADLVFCCRDLLGWAEERAFEVLAGLSDISSAPGGALAKLVRLAEANTALMGLLKQGDAAAIEPMAAADPEFAAALASYNRDFARRTIRYELADPTLAEMPEFLLSLLKAQIQLHYDPANGAEALAARRREALEEARRSLAARSIGDRDRFERAVVRAERAYPLREEHGFYDTSMPLALLRYAALEIGRRLAKRDQIPDATDVFLMEFDEALTALEDGSARCEFIDGRRRERARTLGHPGPKQYGKPLARQPSFAALPADARRVHEAIAWFSHRVFAPEGGGREAAVLSSLSGIGASAGQYTGPVRVICDESDFNRVLAGDVLVCPITSPVWSVLFPSVGALVTDVGGLLSHSAIIAREYGIPAVVNTGTATKALSDGQIVTVDGTAGVVLCG